MEQFLDIFEQGTLIDYIFLLKSIKNINEGVLIERAHYLTILVEGVLTILEGVLIEEGALTEVVRYVSYYGVKRSPRHLFMRAL